MIFPFATSNFNDFFRKVWPPKLRKISELFSSHKASRKASQGVPRRVPPCVLERVVGCSPVLRWGPSSGDPPAAPSLQDPKLPRSPGENLATTTPHSKAAPKKDGPQLGGRGELHIHILHTHTYIYIYEYVILYIYICVYMCVWFGDLASQYWYYHAFV